MKAAATTAVVAASGLGGYAGHAAAPSARSVRKAGRGALLDVNVTLGRWPFRRLPLDDTPALVAKLRQHGVTQAWAGTFDGVFHKDVTSANTWLAEECRRHGRGVLVPFGSVNPKLPDWEEELRRCAELHQMPGLRLHPNYHGYTLDDPALAQLLARAHERRLRVQIVVDLEDERMQHPLARVPHTDLKPLAARLQTLSGLRVVVLNWFRAVKSDVVKSLATAGVGFDLATVEGVGGVASLIGQISAERVLFGSNAPFFYFESAELKLTESALTPEQRRAVCSGNAQRLVARP